MTYVMKTVLTAVSKRVFTTRACRCFGKLALLTQTPTFDTYSMLFSMPSPIIDKYDHNFFNYLNKFFYQIIDILKLIRSLLKKI